MAEGRKTGSDVAGTPNKATAENQRGGARPYFHGEIIGAKA
jgi:hypothetical protein